jgi:hypothetical protein
MSFNFRADRIVNGRVHPAITKWQAEPFTPAWREFVDHWPYSVPVNLIDHCAEHNFPHTISETAGEYYPIALLFFDFTIDYFELLKIKDQLRNKEFRLLFYYDEGDNPFKIKQRLDELCAVHNLDTDCYRFISANTAADNIKGFAYFPGDELLYWQRNKLVAPTPIHSNRREREFTLLSRTHKRWRATAVADLHRQMILDRSYWSYGLEVNQFESTDQNPIDTTGSNGLEYYIETFLEFAPYSCDSLTHQEHNNHGHLVKEHFDNSYCNIVLETHFDADQSQGAFLTEKTFKAIKHGQPFIIAGAPGSLAALRALGYRTFDHAIDNSYDDIKDNTERWLKIVRAVKKIREQDMQAWFNSCLNDVQHNQELFLQSKHSRLNSLLRKLTND